MSVDPDAALTLLESHLIEELVRRDVIRVPRALPSRRGERSTAEHSAWALGGHMTRAELPPTHSTGGSDPDRDEAAPPDSRLLASVSADGSVDLGGSVARTTQATCSSPLFRAPADRVDDHVETRSDLAAGVGWTYDCQTAKKREKAT